MRCASGRLGCTHKEWQRLGAFLLPSKVPLPSVTFPQSPFRSHLSAVTFPQSPFRMGHQQVTDAYLLALAIHHKGRLATLDRKLTALFSEKTATRDVVTVI